MADTNWFYSSLAQSAAAFVGLFGAILAGRAQSDFEAAEEQKLRTTEALNGLHRQAQPLSSYLTAYLPHSEAQFEELNNAMKGGELFLKVSNWHYPDRPPLGNDLVLVESELRDHKIYRTVAGGLVKEMDRLYEQDAEEIMFFFMNADQWLSAGPESNPLMEKIAALSAAAETAYHEWGVLQMRTRKSLLALLVWVLLAVFAGAVVAPLSFLTAQSRTHVAVFLGVFGALASLLFSYLILRLNSLRRLGQYDQFLPPVDKYSYIEIWMREFFTRRRV